MPLAVTLLRAAAAAAFAGSGGGGGCCFDRSHSLRLPAFDTSSCRGAVEWVVRRWHAQRCARPPSSFGFLFPPIFAFRSIFNFWNFALCTLHFALYRMQEMFDRWFDHNLALREVRKRSF
jgi:hypothetical protein